MLHGHIPIHYVIAFRVEFGERYVQWSSIKVDRGKDHAGKRTLRQRAPRGASIEGCSLGFLGREYPRQRQDIVNAEAATDGGLAVAEHVISKANSWFEIARRSIALEKILDGDKWPARSKYGKKLVVRLARVRTQLVTQT